MTPASRTDEDFEQLLEHIRRMRGFDLGGYKRSTLHRRVEKRMADLRIDSYDELVDRIEASPDEFDTLLETILINVSGFFRDAAVWRYVEETVIPRIVAGHAEDGPVRIWSAGCATGEEPYTIAILLAEALGPEGFRERVKIFATDIDMGALDIARAATYEPKQVESVPEELLERYFVRVDDRYVFDKDLRRAVIFGRNDITIDAPISRLDMLACRNTLMYFNAEAQIGIVRRLHLALKDDGVLVLGKAEMLRSFTDGFRPEQLSLRIFRKIPGTRIHELARIQAVEPPAPPPTQTVLEEAFDSASTAQMVVDASGAIVLVNQRLRLLFAVGTPDIGRRLADLELSYRPVELRSLIDQATTQGQAVRTGPITWRPRGGDEMQLEVEVRPLPVGDEAAGSVTVSFIDVTGTSAIRTQLEQSKHDLETAYEELQSTVEELETTNEELQSTNEEFETTNEELQSANEELETMNEELQSNNEELATMNEELRIRTDELHDANGLMAAMLGALGVAVAVVDPDLRIQLWNDRAKDLWGFDATEVQGRHFLELEIGMPLEQLREPLEQALAGREADGTVVEGRDRRGREISCRVRCAPLKGDGARIDGAIVLMEVLDAGPATSAS